MSDPAAAGPVTPEPPISEAEEAMHRRRVRRRAFIGLGLFLTAIVIGVGGFVWVFLHNSLPPTNGVVSVPGVESEVFVYRDERGVPQIFAKSVTDAYFALGWTHASDRLFQMEVVRRLAVGRLSQLAGREVYEEDVISRVLGHYRMAQEQVDSLDEETRAIVDAYCLGINGYLARTGKRPLEMKVLRAPWDPWRPYELLAILSWQSWIVDRMLSDDEAYFEMYERFGREAAEAARYVSDGTVPTTVGQTSGSGFDGLGSAWRPSFASNAFAVAPEKSASGKALLALDPHVDITRIPGLWYIVGMHIEDTGLAAVGVTTPGLPCLVMGHTKTTAFGATAGGFDVVDTFEETVDPEDPARYLGPDGSLPFEVIDDEMIVRGEREPVPLRVRWTRHGPLWPGRDSEDGSRVYAIRWAGHDMDWAAALAASLRVPYSRDFDEFRATATSLGAMNLNWLWAEADGGIGYQLGAPVPIRGASQALLPIDGRVAANDWQGYRSLDETPHVYRPEKGWLASCNNPPARASVSYELPGTYAFDRIRRAEELFADRPSISADDLVRAQLDLVDPLLRDWRLAAADTLAALGESAKAEAVRAWDGTMALDSHEAAILALWRHALCESVFEDEIERLGTYRMIERVFDDASSRFWDDVDTDAVETRDDVFAETMRSVLERVEGGATLGDVQSLRIGHPFGRSRAGKFLRLTRGPFPWPGSVGTLSASFSKRADGGGLATVAAPSWRYVLDFADVDSCRMAMPGGQSGHPLSDHFFDWFPDFQAGEYHTVPISREAVEEAAVATLRIIP